MVREVGLAHVRKAKGLVTWAALLPIGVLVTPTGGEVVRGKGRRFAGLARRTLTGNERPGEELLDLVTTAFSGSLVCVRDARNALARVWRIGTAGATFDFFGEFRDEFIPVRITTGDCFTLDPGIIATPPTTIGFTILACPLAAAGGDMS